MTGNGKMRENYQPEDFVTDESFINYYFKLNKEDEIFWEKWLIAHPQNNKLAEAAKEILQNLSLTLPEQEYKAELAKIRKAINYEGQRYVRNKTDIIRLLTWQKTSVSVKDRVKKYAKYLLPAILVFVLGGYFLLKHFTMQADQLMEKYNDSSKPEVLTLSDGTIVTLAAQCVFRYPQGFGNKERKVYLNGEAQFQVNRDEAHPFKVYSGDIVATVLGTVFNIKKRPGDSVILVELIKGKLKVETTINGVLSSQSLILNPDERAVYMRHGEKLSKEKWQSQVDASLQPNHFVFRQSNFEDVANQLKTVFGVTVINQSNKIDWRFTGEFKNTSAINILESISIVEKLKYEVHGDTVFIK